MADVAELAIRIRHEGVEQAARSLDRLAQSADKAEREVDGFGRGTDKAKRGADELERSTTRAGRGLDAVAGPMRALTGALATLGVALGVREIVRFADAWTNTASQLRLVTNTVEQASRAQERLVRLAVETRSGFEGTVTIYTRLARASDELRGNHERLEAITRAINQAMIISGSSAESANAALVQFAQGLQSGTLRGEELNSVLEQAPRLASAIIAGLQQVAPQLGVTAQNFRQLAADGKLTSDVIIAAVESQAAVIEREFGRMNISIGQAFTNLGTAFTAVIGGMGEVSGASALVANAINGVAQAMLSPAFRDFANTVATGIVAGFRLWLDVMGAVVDGVAAVAGALGELTGIGLDDIGQAFVAIGDAVADAASAVRVFIGEADDLGGAFDPLALSAREAVEAIGELAATRLSELNASLEEAGGGLRGLQEDTVATTGFFNALGEDLRDLFANLDWSGTLDSIRSIRDGLNDAGESLRPFIDRARDAARAFDDFNPLNIRNLGEAVRDAVDWVTDLARGAGDAEGVIADLAGVRLDGIVDAVRGVYDWFDRLVGLRVRDWLDDIASIRFDAIVELARDAFDAFTDWVSVDLSGLSASLSDIAGINLQAVVDTVRDLALVLAELAGIDLGRVGGFLDFLIELDRSAATARNSVLKFFVDALGITDAYNAKVQQLTANEELRVQAMLDIARATELVFGPGIQAAADRQVESILQLGRATAELLDENTQHARVLTDLGTVARSLGFAEDRLTTVRREGAAAATAGAAANEDAAEAAKKLADEMAKLAQAQQEATAAATAEVADLRAQIAIREQMVGISGDYAIQIRDENELRENGLRIGTEAARNFTLQADALRQLEDRQRITTELSKVSLDLNTAAGQSYADLVQEVINLERVVEALGDAEAIAAQKRKDYLRDHRDQLLENMRLTNELFGDVLAQNEAQEAAGERMKEIWTNALENIQSLFADTFTDIFRGNVTNFQDFADAARDIFTGLAGELASALVIGSSAYRAIEEGLKSAFQAAFDWVKDAFGAVTNFIAQQLGTTAANVQSYLGTAALGAGIGGVAAGITGGNQIGGLLGGAFGSTAGRALGTAAAPFISQAIGATLGSWAGPVGSALGGALGGILGGFVGNLFGNEPSDRTQIARVALATEKVAQEGLTGDKFSQENRNLADRLAQSTIDTTRLIEQLTGGRATGQVGIVAGDREGLRVVTGTGAARESTTVANAQEAAALIVQYIVANLRGVKDEVTRQALTRIDTSSLGTIERDIGLIARFSEFVKGVGDAAGEAATPTQQLAQYLRATFKEFETLSRNAERLGFPTEDLEQGLRDRISVPIQAFVEASRGAQTEVQQLAASFREMFAQARLLGDAAREAGRSTADLDAAVRRNVMVPVREFIQAAEGGQSAGQQLAQTINDQVKNWQVLRGALQEIGESTARLDQAMRQNITNAVDEFVASVRGESPFAALSQQMTDLRERFQVVRQAAVEFGIPLNDLTAAFREGTGALRGDFLNTLRELAGIDVQAGTQKFVQEFRSLNASFEEALALAPEFGVKASEVQRLYGVALQNLGREFGAELQTIVTDMVANLNPDQWLARFGEIRINQTRILEALGVPLEDINSVFDQVEQRLVEAIESGKPVDLTGIDFTFEIPVPDITAEVPEIPPTQVTLRVPAPRMEIIQDRIEQILVRQNVPAPRQEIIQEAVERGIARIEVPAPGQEINLEPVRQELVKIGVPAPLQDIILEAVERELVTIPVPAPEIVIDTGDASAAIVQKMRTFGANLSSQLNEIVRLADPSDALAQLNTIMQSARGRAANLGIDFSFLETMFRNLETQLQTNVNRVARGLKPIPIDIPELKFEPKAKGPQAPKVVEVEAPEVRFVVAARNRRQEVPIDTSNVQFVVRGGGPRQVVPINPENVRFEVRGGGPRQVVPLNGAGLQFEVRGLRNATVPINGAGLQFEVRGLRNASIPINGAGLQFEVRGLRNASIPINGAGLQFEVRGLRNASIPINGAGLQFEVRGLRNAAIPINGAGLAFEVRGLRNAAIPINGAGLQFEVRGLRNAAIPINGAGLSFEVRGLRNAAIPINGAGLQFEVRGVGSRVIPVSGEGIRFELRGGPRQQVVPISGEGIRFELQGGPRQQVVPIPAPDVRFEVERVPQRAITVDVPAPRIELNVPRIPVQSETINIPAPRVTVTKAAVPVPPAQAFNIPAPRVTVTKAANPIPPAKQFNIPAPRVTVTKAANPIPRAVAFNVPAPRVSVTKGTVRVPPVHFNVPAPKVTTSKGGFAQGGEFTVGQRHPLVQQQYLGRFQTGGSSVVGGSGGTDSTLVSFLATPGERVTVTTPGKAASRTSNDKRSHLEIIEILKDLANATKPLTASLWQQVTDIKQALKDMERFSSATQATARDWARKAMAAVVNELQQGIDQLVGGPGIAAGFRELELKATDILGAASALGEQFKVMAREAIVLARRNMREDVLGQLRQLAGIEDPAAELTNSFREFDRAMAEAAIVARGLGIAEWELQKIRAQGERAIREQFLSTARDATRTAAETALGNIDKLLNPFKELARDLATSNLGGFSPAEQLRNLQREFHATLAAARAGDVAAIEALPQLGRSLLDLSREVTGGRFHAETFNEVAAAVNEFQGRLQVERDETFREVGAYLGGTIDGGFAALIASDRENFQAQKEILLRIERVLRERPAA